MLIHQNNSRNISKKYDVDNNFSQADATHTKGLNSTSQFVTIINFITKTPGNNTIFTKPNKHSSLTKTSLSVAVGIICHVSQINRAYFISQWEHTVRLDS